MYFKSPKNQFFILSIGLFFNTSIAHSNDVQTSFSSAIGYSWFHANELVYDSAGGRISELNWDSHALTFNANSDISLSNGWWINLDGTTALKDNSYMIDYDWLYPYAPTYAAEDWSHRSIHPDTKLDHHTNLSISLAKNILNRGNNSYAVEAGYKYTNTKWTAYGGDITYSVGGFRNYSTTDSSDIAGISYEQWFNTAFLGASSKTVIGNFSFKLGVRAGATINAKDEDYHYLRDLKFVDEFGSVPFLGLNSNVTYKANNHFSIFGGLDLEHYLRAKGDTTTYSISTGNQLTGVLEDSVGIDFSSINLKLGMKLNL